MHERQHYRLVNWRRADTELNYRRFFDVTTLAGVRVEDPEVFDATHAEMLRWVGATGWSTGLRVDHPDGLADPGGYLRRLRRGRAGGAGWWWRRSSSPDEARCRPTLAGATAPPATTRCAEVCGLFVDPAARAR